MKGYKGFNKGLICRGKQYAENMVFEEETAKICESGMHFCENPFDVLDYYGFVDDNGNLNEFAEVEPLAKVHKNEDGDKCCTTKLKIGTKVGIMGLVKAFVNFTLERITEKKTNMVYFSAATSTGDYSAATSTGDWSAATNTGYHSAATVSGKESIAIATGFNSKAKGALGCWIVLAEWDDNAEHIICVKSHKVDGNTIKADTFYTLKNGEFVKAE